MASENDNQDQDQERESKKQLSSFGQRLVEDGVVSEHIANMASSESSKQRVSFVHYLITNKLASSRPVASAASEEFGLPVFDLEAYDLETIPKDLLNQNLVQKTRVLPLFKRGNKLFVGISDPTNLQGLDQLRFRLGLAIEPVVVDDDKLTYMIDKALTDQEAESFSNEMDVGLEELDITAGDDLSESQEYLSTKQAKDDTPVVRFVNKIIIDAINSGSSDIHFEPYEKIYRIRFRQDGILVDKSQPPVTLAPRISARIKVMSSLDISERRVPQDGRFKMKISKNRSIDFRVSTCPTIYGEKVVMRILDPTIAATGIDSLGYEPAQKRLFLEAINKPHGMVIVTGPTGSGKTVSLYTALNILNTPQRNISTCEDPVEINLQGINQVNVNPKAGLTFPVALRAFLRQDPDVIMVGEIRDFETAEIAIKAAQTGHMVLSTLHTNSASDSLTRLINMGVPAYNLASSVALIIAQRLARTLCNKCKVPVELPRETLLEVGFTVEDLDDVHIFAPKGCEFCSNGYKGRIGIFETLPITPEITNIILRGASSVELQNEAIRQGMWTMRRSGLMKVKQGLISLEELNRVTID